VGFWLGKCEFVPSACLSGGQGSPVQGKSKIIGTGPGFGGVRGTSRGKDLCWFEGKKNEKKSFDRDNFIGDSGIMTANETRGGRFRCLKLRHGHGVEGEDWLDQGRRGSQTLVGACSRQESA